jgi:hypothetical protein
MSDIQGENYEKAREEIEKLRLENSEPMEQMPCLYRAGWTNAQATCPDRAVQVPVDPRRRCARERPVRNGFSISPGTEKGGQ